METILLCSLARRQDPEWSPTQKCSDHFSIHTIIHCGGQGGGDRGCGGQTGFISSVMLINSVAATLKGWFKKDNEVTAGLRVCALMD